MKIFNFHKLSAHLRGGDIMEKIVRCCVLILFAVLCIGVASMAEEITLTTYYPAPYGSYEELQAIRLAVGSTASMPAGDGDLSVGDNIDAASYSVGGTAGYSGVIQVLSNDGVTTVTITVTNGIITNVTP
jgi:hypothetical protein